MNNDIPMWTSQIPSQRRPPLLATFEAKNRSGQIVQRVMINLNEILWVDEDVSLLVYMAGFPEALKLHMSWQDFNDRLTEIAAMQTNRPPRRQ